MADEPVGLRDALARERTHLANERTLLAYVRTAIMLLATGGTLIKIAEGSRALQWVGGAFLLLALSVAVFGANRFQKMRQRLLREG